MKKILLAAIIFISALTTVYSQCTLATVAITQPTSITICQGVAQPLSGFVSVTAAAQNTNFTYSWIKTIGAAPGIKVPPTALTIPANVATAVPAYTGITGMVTDAGTYVLRVEDGNAGNTACYAEATVVVTVTPTTVAGTISADQTICAGAIPNPLTGMASTGGVTVKNYKWQSSLNGTVWTTQMATPYSPAATGFAPGALTQTTYYRRIDSSGVCFGVSTNVTTITVTPAVIAGVISTDQTICAGDNPITLTGTTSTGGVTVKNYKWQRSVIGPIGVWSNVAPYSPAATGFAPAALTADTWYRRIDSSGACIGTATNAVKITVKPTGITSVTITADKIVICEGNPVTFTATPTNGGTSPLYQWHISTTAQGTATTNNTFTTSDLKGVTSGPGNVVHVEMISNQECASATAVSSNIIAVSVNTGVRPGSLSADQIICYGTSAGKITEVTASDAVTATYTWEQSNYPSVEQSWVPANGTSSNGGKDFTPSGILTSDMYYRRRVDDAAAPAPCDKAFTTPVKITVNPDIVGGVIASTGGATCENEEAGNINNVSLPAGGNSAITPAFTYVWESTTTDPSSGGNFSPAAGTNTRTAYDPGKLSVTTYYRRREVSSCGTVYSNVITKSITPKTIVDVTIADPGQICAGTAVTLTATPSGGGGSPVYKWSYKGVVVSGVNGDTYTFIPPVGSDNINTVIRVELTSSDECNTGVTSATVALDIVNAVIPGITIQGNAVTCEGFPLTFSVLNEIGQGLNPRYDWYVRGIVDQTGTDKTFKTSDLNDGDKVWVELISDLACKIATNPFKSNEITVQIKPMPDPTINEPGNTICSPSTYALTAQVQVPGYPGSSYQWLRDGNAIFGATTLAYTATESGMYAITESNGTCNNTSRSVTLTVDPCGAFSTSINGPDPVTPGQQNAVYSVPNQADFSYEWTVTGGTIVSGQHTNAVTVDWDVIPGNAAARTTASLYSISVKETNKDKLSKTTTLQLNNVTTNVSKSLAQSGISLFPNPAAESFNIDMPASGVAVSYEILDLTGASVAKGNFVSTSSAEKITTNFGAGMYQVVLRYNDVVTTGRLSKVQ